MLKIDPAFVDRAMQADTHADLAVLLQKAIELEHSTIPPYLTAMISLKPRRNREAWAVIHSVVVEEMLHMTIAANILNALDGEPVINGPEFIPTYPGPLPMNVGDGLIVGLERYSKEQIHDVFMAIEEPEEPLDFPKPGASAADEAGFATIGQFYHALAGRIQELGIQRLPGNAVRQVVDDTLFAAHDLFPILTADDAVRAINIIVEQGEGTGTAPVDCDGNYAHYYRFEELYVGRRLVLDPSVPEGYSFSGDPSPFDEAGVYPLAANTKSAELPTGSEQRRWADQFNFTYSNLLNGLHRTFNGEPTFLSSTLGLMYDVKLIGARLAAMEHPTRSGETVGPPFEYAAVND